MALYKIMREDFDAGGTIAVFLEKGDTCSMTYMMTETYGVDPHLYSIYLDAKV